MTKRIWTAFILVALAASAVAAQAPGAMKARGATTIEQRLDALEKHVANLEADNQYLRNQVEYLENAVSVVTDSVLLAHDRIDGVEQQVGNNGDFQLAEADIRGLYVSLGMTQCRAPVEGLYSQLPLFGIVTQCVVNSSGIYEWVVVPPGSAR